MRYWIGCLVLAIAAGGPGSFLVFYLGNFNVTQAWHETVSASVFSIFQVTQQVPVAQGLAEVVVSTLSLFVDMYLTGYLRQLVVAARPKLSPLAQDGEAAYQRAFGPMTSLGGSLFFTLVFFLLYFPARALLAGNLVSLVGITFLSLLAFTIYGAAFGVYLSCVLGVSRFGLEPLKLKHFSEDRMLGLRPLGQIVVYSAGIFSIAITITLGASLITGDVASLAINLVIVAIGVSMLFIPLLGIHKRMVEVKEEEEAKLSSLSKILLSSPKRAGPTNHEVSPANKIEELIELQRFKVLTEWASNISEWPFETRTVERLIAILLAIFAAVLARLLELPH
ncbi:MAG: hypothetical protein WB778_10310 [Thermoplasmata archaeon]